MIQFLLVLVVLYIVAQLAWWGILCLGVTVINGGPKPERPDRSERERLETELLIMQMNGAHPAEIGRLRYRFLKANQP